MVTGGSNQLNACTDAYVPYSTCTVVHVNAEIIVTHIQYSTLHTQGNN